MSRVNIWHRYFSFCFPRVSGDEPDAALKERAVALFSPRERG